MPFNLKAVLLRLNIKLCTPTPPALEAALWELKTLSNVCELEF